MASRQKKKERTRKRLVEAALSLFAENGILAARTADVAKAAKVSHGAVFVHFPTRDDLVAAVIERFSERVIRRIHDLVEAGFNEAGVRQVLEAHLAGLSEHEAFYRRLVMEGPLLPPYARSLLVGIQSAISFHLEAAARREMEAGTVRRVPQPMLFNTWIGLVHYYLCNKDLFAPKGSVLDRHGRDLLDHYVSLLTTKQYGGPRL